MKRVLHLSWLVLVLLGSSAVVAGEHPSQADNKPLRPVGKCLDAGSITEWHIINDTTLIARNGPRHYLVTTTHKCPRLGKHGGGLSFRPSHGKMGEWTICGDLGETVSSRYQPPCAVESVKIISKQRFDALDKQAQRSGSGAVQPTLPPKRH